MNFSESTIVRGLTHHFYEKHKLKIKLMKKALRETQTLRALAVVRFGHRPPARPPARRPPVTDRTDYNTLRR